MQIDQLLSLRILSPAMLTAIGSKLPFSGAAMEVVEDINQAQAFAAQAA
jgi:hypothetical protein